MEYRSGSIGRFFSVRFDDGDDFLQELQALIIKEKIKHGIFHIVGGMREADVVTGPRKPDMPPDPVWKDVREVKEVLGSGSIAWDGAEPKIHLHAAMGHHGDTLTACVRKGTKVYLVLEVYIFEISGIDASRPWYDEGGFNQLTFS
jgi:predicted DNA-binding protein with PD1-like motif